MNFRFTFILALAGMLSSSCSNEESLSSGGSISAEMEDTHARTSVTDEGTFSWSSGDRIWLHTTSGSIAGTLSSGAGTSSADFTFGTYFGEMTGRAAYPYNPEHSIDGDRLNFVLPASYDLGTQFSNTNAAMYGVDEGGTIRFSHMAGVMRFVFRNVPSGTDRFTITMDKKINGTFTADLASDFPVLETEATSDTDEQSVTLNFDALTETSDIRLYIPLPLGTYNTIGLSLCRGAETVWTYSNTVSNTISRKSLKLMPAITLGGSIGGELEDGGYSERFQAVVNRTNTNLSGLQAIADAIQKKDHITDVTPLMEDYKEKGCILHFFSSLSATIYHGKESIHIPQISLKKDEEGIYHWTLNGEWMQDSSGRRLPISASTPKVKIEEEYWHISFDNAANWTRIDKATEEDNASLFSSMTKDADYVYLTLSDGTVFSIPTRQLATGYWKGKKFVMNGDSIAYGSGLSSNYDAFPHLVAAHFGMSITNYAIGGTVVARRAKDYDECYTDMSEWEADMKAGLLNTKKKYLVNTGTGAPRIYRIYSYKNSSWVAGGNASTSTGRTPLSDRIRAMDTDADVIMIMAGSNDFYYNWTPFGDFESGKYRNELENIDPDNNLLDSENVELRHNCAPTSSGPEPDNSYTAYFSYLNIPVAGGCAVKVPKGRRGWWLDKNGKGISTKNFTSEGSDYTLIAPSNAVSLTVCFKYEEIAPEDCAVYMSVPSDENAPNETFCDGLHKLCRYLCNTYKDKDIIFLTPVKRKQPAGTGGGTWDCIYPEDTNAEGKTLKDYRDAIIEACEYYSIPYIDTYTISGLNPHIDPSIFADTDGRAVHPNEEGHRRLASAVIGAMHNIRQ